MGESALEYYRKNAISTGHGVDAEWDKHIARRRKLYRQLGIPTLAFKGSNVLEIGPGDGHNALPLLTEWHAAHIDLLEPNETARRELQEKFRRENAPSGSYTVYPVALEEYQTSKKYDIVIAEGFLQYEENWRECLSMIVKLTHEDSVVIVTCTDEISYYVEKMKRAVMQYMVRDVEGHEKKIRILAEIMKPQLSMLKGMSRAVEDWIEDQFFYPMGFELVTLGKAIDYYGNQFDVLGASQNIFVDYSWYKDFEYDYIASYRRQYDEKKHMFLVAGDDREAVRTAEENRRLEEAVTYANIAARKIEEEQGNISELAEAVIAVTESTVNPIIIEFNSELIEIIEKLEKKEVVDWTKYETYMKCFGKAIQYLSFMKK